MLKAENILQNERIIILRGGMRVRFLLGVEFNNAPNCSANPTQFCSIHAKT